MSVRIEIVAKQKSDHPPRFMISVQDTVSKPENENDPDPIYLGWKRQFEIISERVGTRVITYNASRDDYAVLQEYERGSRLVSRAPTFPLAVEAAAKDLERVYLPEVENYKKEALAMGDAVQWLFRSADVQTDDEGREYTTDENGGRVWTFSMLTGGGANEKAETESSEEAP